jgi:spore germination protein
VKLRMVERLGKVAIVLVPVLTVALAGTAYWGYTESQEKNAILIKAENQYQREFHNLAFYMDALRAELGKSIAMNSRKQLGPCLTNVWRITNMAQNSVGQLPLTLMPFNKTEAFLSRIGDFSYKTAVRDLEKKPLTDTEWKTLNNLYKSASEIQSELRKVQDQIYAKNLRWMDVEMALASEDKQTDNTIIDGFKLIDERVDGYAEIDMGIAAQNSEELRIDKLKKLQGEKVSVQEAKKIALNFTGLKDGQNVKVTENSDKAYYRAYDINIHNPKSGSDVIVEVTQNGGHVIWMLDTREIGKQRVSIENAEVRAQRFIRQKGFESMESAKIERYDNVAVFTFVPNQRGVLIYPEAIIVKVALDNGQVMGYQAEDYIVNHKKERSFAPKISVDEAKKRINPNFKVEKETLALIHNDLNQEILCYEFSGTINKEYYKIYINAENLEEEKVEHLQFES